MTVPDAINVIFIEDDAPLRDAVIQGLELEGLAVETFDAALPALRRLSDQFEGVIVSDIRLPGMDGLELFEEIRAMDAELPLIFTTGHGDVAMAVEAMKNGAADFLAKPYSTSALLTAIRRAAGRRALVIENRRLREALRGRTLPRILGSSPPIERLKRLIGEVGKADIDLLITGDSGTGKSFLARQIHDLSQRHDRPFVTVGAETWAHQDAELIIFGRDPGSALSRSGLIERANGGTLFIDDLDTVPGPLQARMLGLVEQRRYLPIGAGRSRQANVRIIAAAHHPSDRDPGSGSVRQSLLNRLNSVNLLLPPLASRREDVPELFSHFLLSFEREFETLARNVEEVEWHHLMTHDWPGNLHELRSYARNHVLGLHLREHGGKPAAISGPGTLKERVASFEKLILEDAMRQCGGSAAKAGQLLNLPRKTIYDKLAKHGIFPKEYRTPRPGF
jgi:two-component system C4-dicarboxylate transport response regulator DctD